MGNAHIDSSDRTTSLVLSQLLFTSTIIVCVERFKLLGREANTYVIYQRHYHLGQVKFSQGR